MQRSLNSPSYYLQGKTLNLNTEPKTVYLGVPELWHGHEKPNAVLFAKLSYSDTWQALNSQLQGVYQLGWQNAEGDFIYQTLCALLPEQFSIEKDADGYGITIMHSGRAYISCASPFVKSIHTLGDGRHIELANEAPLESVDILLRWSGMADKLMISVPLISKKPMSVQHLNDVKTLNDALAIDDERLKTLFIRHHLKQLTKDFQAASWQDLLNTPVTDTNIWQAAIQEPRVLVALAIQAKPALLLQLNNHYSIFWERIAIRDWLAVFARFKRQLALTQTDTKKYIEKLSVLSPCSSVVMQLLNQTLFDELDDELLFMQTEEAALLISEQLQDEQQQFIKRHADELCLMDLETESLNEWQTLPDITKQLLNDITEHTAVTLLPLLTVHHALIAKPSDKQDSAQLIALKAFDTLWFNTAYTLALAYLSQQPNYATTLQQDTAAMIEHDEHDLVAEIEQQLSLANQAVQGLHDDVQNLAGGAEALEALVTENQQLNEEIEKLSNIIKQRDATLQNLLAEIKKLNAKIQEIRSELKA